MVEEKVRGDIVRSDGSSASGLGDDESRSLGCLLAS